MYNNFEISLVVFMPNITTKSCCLSSLLLLQVVVLSDHFPSFSHNRTRDPASLYPFLQEKEDLEPNDNPHDREAMSPKTGGWITGHDTPASE